MKLFFVDGIDKVTWRPIVFAVCTSEGKANAAKEALEKKRIWSKIKSCYVKSVFGQDQNWRRNY